ncbi:MAG: type ISP restriction/modification enzyme, partial [Candidatus Uhrbacteria bacterium]|nr:type ISP restriction/modification enzyme [Candidatus Uhrbacteria bacterium]
IAHLKLSIAFKQTGFTIFNKRLGIYLTNSLEQAGPQADLLSLGFAQSIAEEAKEAAVIKNETPIMVVLGNPPYSGESSNAFYTGHDVYKVEPTGGKLQERNSKWLNDDYVKFIRLAESMIEKTGEGVVAMITAHGYIDNPTFRGMRWHLRNTFSKIYILDLHGNSRKKEVSPDGSKDENVFNIMTGVSIIVGIKTSDKSKDKKLATVYICDMYGTRGVKFQTLDASGIETIQWTELPGDCDIWKIEGENKEEYNKSFSVNDFFTVSSVGIVTGRDAVVISEDKELLKKNIVAYANNENFEYKEDEVVRINYRPFDTRYIYYDKKFIERGRWDVMRHFVNENIGLIFKRGGIEEKSAPVFVSDYISESRSWSRPGMQGIEFLAPLYLYADDGGRVPNLKKEIVADIEKVVGKTTPEDIFDYIYAMLYSPSYREKYKEFLKIDFPRVPYPKDKKQFSSLAVLGKELRELHLLESPKVRKFITSYPESGSNAVEKIAYKDGKVYINASQYFGGVPEVAWNFYIGGYQPAQKWLKDRKGRTLTNEDIEHYQKMIVVLVETDRIMKEIDNV